MLSAQVTIVSGFPSNSFESIHVYVSVGKGVGGSKIEHRAFKLNENFLMTRLV